MTEQTQKPDLLQMTVQIATSQRFIGPSSQFPHVLREIYEGLKDIQKKENLDNSKLAVVPIKPAATARPTVGEDYIICLEDNTPHKSLKRYIKAKFHMTWNEYLEKHSLPLDYPSVCKALAKQRSSTAKKSKMWEVK